MEAQVNRSRKEAEKLRRGEANAITEQAEEEAKVLLPVLKAQSDLQ